MLCRDICGVPTLLLCRPFVANEMDFLKSKLDTFAKSASNAGQQEILQIKNRQLRVDKLLGEGGFAWVYLAEDTQSGEKFALKRMMCQNQRQKQLAETEVNLMVSFYPHLNDSGQEFCT